MKKSFIIYPPTKIETSNHSVRIVEAPIKIKLKAFITGYIEDYLEMPSPEKIASLFNISVADANISLMMYGENKQF